MAARLRGGVVAVFAALVMVVGLLGSPTASAAPPVTGVTGTVTDSSSAPVAGVNVSVFGWYYGNLLGTAVTDGAGQYLIPTAGGVTVKVRVDDPTHTNATTYNGNATTWGAAPNLTVPPSSFATANITVGSFTGTIAGHVTHPGGSPFAGVKVEAVNATYGVAAATTTTDANGDYTLPNLAPTAYKVRFTGPDPDGAILYNGGTIAWPDTPTVAVTSGATATVDQTQPDAGTITGTVTAGGVPRAGIYAAALRAAGPPELIAYATTDATGAYTIGRLAPGAYKVVFIDPASISNGGTAGLRPVMHPAYDLLTTTMAAAQAAAPDVTVPAGSAATGVDAHLKGWQCPATLDGAHPNLTGADLSNQDLTGCDLSAVTLTGANLAGTNLTGATLTGLTSGNLTGTPAALPTNWSILSGYLVGPEHLGVNWTGAADANYGASYEFSYTEDPDYGPNMSVTTGTTWQDLVSTRSGQLLALRLYIPASWGSGEMHVMLGSDLVAVVYPGTSGVVTLSIGPGRSLTAGAPVTLSMDASGPMNSSGYFLVGAMTTPPPGATTLEWCSSQDSTYGGPVTSCGSGGSLWVQAIVV